MDIIVFNEELVPQGTVDAFTALMWNERFASSGSFELWCSATEQNAELIKEDNILWIGEKTAAFIEIIQKDAGEDNTQINAKGRFIQGYLSFRTVWDTYNATNKKVSTIVRELITQNVISPINNDRKIPLISLNESQTDFGDEINVQRTGGNLLETIESLLSSHNLGYSLDFYPQEKSIKFSVLQGVDRTINQSVVNPVVFSSDTEDILSSSYFHNKSDLKTIAFVAGEGEGNDRKKLIVGQGIGLKRREIYVDARDLQQTNTDGVTMPIDDYNKLLQQRGLEKINENKEIENFDAVIKSYGNQQYIYGIDYKIGDSVTVIDNVLKVVVNAKITEVERVYDENGYSLNLIFGYAQPTLNKKLKYLGLEV